MNISLPDLHIGRCPNLRASRYRFGTFLRCLDYADVPHTCTFEDEEPPLSGPFSVYTPKPKRWVRP